MTTWTVVLLALVTAPSPVTVLVLASSLPHGDAAAILGYVVAGLGSLTGLGLFGRWVLKQIAQVLVHRTPQQADAEIRSKDADTKGKEVRTAGEALDVVKRAQDVANERYESVIADLKAENSELKGQLREERARTRLSDQERRELEQYRRGELPGKLGQKRQQREPGGNDPPSGPA